MRRSSNYQASICLIAVIVGLATGWNETMAGMEKDTKKVDKSKKSDTPETKEDKNTVKPVWRDDFSKTEKKDNKEWPVGWEFKGKTFTNKSDFEVKKEKGDSVLVMKSKNATGTILREVKGVDLKKTPIVRWRWKVTKLPKGADGRDSKKDDQAIGIYIGTGTWSQHSIAYRWETDTPKGEKGSASYGGGMVKVKWFCLRDKKDPIGTWFIEERNVAEDFKKEFGYIPDTFAVSVVSNSQYTGTDAEAELDWIEFLPKK